MLQIIVDWFVNNILGLDSSSRLGESMNFFLYDSIKIILLLFVMILVIGFLRTYVPQKKIKKWLSGKKKGFAHVIAALFGALTPFCSCSSIPIFIGFLEAGVPLGVTFSFLITSPLINEYLVVLMWGFFGWKITLAYVAAGLFIGVFSGWIIGLLKLEKYIVKDLVTQSKQLKDKLYKTIKSRVRFGFDEAFSIVKKIWIWILVGVAIGALIHNYIPSELIQNIIGKAGFFAVPLAVLIGVPMYGNCAAIVPIAVVLFQKGIPLGTALAFMMATAALSFPEAIILRRAIKLKLILIFFGIVALGIIIVGFLLNILQPFFV